MCYINKVYFLIFFNKSKENKSANVHWLNMKVIFLIPHSHYLMWHFTFYLYIFYSLFIFDIFITCRNLNKTIHIFLFTLSPPNRELKETIWTPRERIMNILFWTQPSISTESNFSALQVHSWNTLLQHSLHVRIECPHIVYSH